MVLKSLTRVHNPHKAYSKSKTRKRKTHRKNPIPAVMTLGVINPHKGVSTMARKKRRSSQKRRNPFTAHRKTTVRRKATRRYHAKKRRNPVVSAGGFGKDMAVSVAGGLAGVTVTRMLVGVVSGMLPSASGGIMRVILTGVAAFGTGKIFSAISPNFGAAAAFGGYMAAGSEALNVFAPSLGSSFGLRGLGAFVPAQFAVPEDSIRRGMQLAAPMPSKGVSGYPAVARF